MEIFTDASLHPEARSHQGLQSKWVIRSTFCVGTVPDRNWSQSSAETELIALMSGFKATNSFQHLLSESVADLTLVLRCDNPSPH